jgi:hypothetical protein
VVAVAVALIVQVAQVDLVAQVAVVLGAPVIWRVLLEP